MDVDNFVFVRIKVTQVLMPPGDEACGSFEEAGLVSLTVVDSSNPFTFQHQGTGVVVFIALQAMGVILLF